MTEATQQQTVASYLWNRLAGLGATHAFGVPGDYALDLLDVLVASPIRWVGTCNELNAGYAADGYARMNGIGVAVVTYGVGGYSVLNAAVGADAEAVPLVVVSGAPASARRRSGAMVHHLAAGYTQQLDVYGRCTAAAVLLDDPETAADEIERVLHLCVTEKRPVYLEVPLDIVHTPCSPHKRRVNPAPAPDPQALAECVAEAVELLDAAQRPLVLAGLEVPRFGLSTDVLRLVEALELPFATMVSSKSSLPELHPQFVGIYQGAWSRPEVTAQVEESDGLLALGVWMTDIDSGGFSAHLPERKTIRAGRAGVRIGYHSYPGVKLRDLVLALTTAARPREYLASHPARTFAPAAPFVAEAGAKLTSKRFWERIGQFLTDDTPVVVDPGDAFCAAPDLHVAEAENFLVQPYYASIGWAVPAALGVALARPGKRPVVLTGDGAFQMTAQELSTHVRMGTAPVVVVLNNDGYLIERLLHEDGPYNDIQPWRYHALPAVFGEGAIGIKATTERELEAALETAERETKSLVLIEACFDRLDASDALKRLAAGLRKK